MSINHPDNLIGVFGNQVIVDPNINSLNGYANNSNGNEVNVNTKISNYTSQEINSNHQQNHLPQNGFINNNGNLINLTNTHSNNNAINNTNANDEVSARNKSIDASPVSNHAKSPNQNKTSKTSKYNMYPSIYHKGDNINNTNNNGNDNDNEDNVNDNADHDNVRSLDQNHLADDYSRREDADKMHNIEEANHLTAQFDHKPDNDSNKASTFSLQQMQQIQQLQQLQQSHPLYQQQLYHQPGNHWQYSNMLSGMPVIYPSIVSSMPVNNLQIQPQLQNMLDTLFQQPSFNLSNDPAKILANNLRDENMKPNRNKNNEVNSEKADLDSDDKICGHDNDDESKKKIDYQMQQYKQLQQLQLEQLQQFQQFQQLQLQQLQQLQQQQQVPLTLDISTLSNSIIDPLKLTMNFQQLQQFQQSQLRKQQQQHRQLQGDHHDQLSRQQQNQPNRSINNNDNHSNSSKESNPNSSENIIEPNIHQNANENSHYNNQLKGFISSSIQGDELSLKHDISDDDTSKSHDNYTTNNRQMFSIPPPQAAIPPQTQQYQTVQQYAIQQIQQLQQYQQLQQLKMYPQPNQMPTSDSFDNGQPCDINQDHQFSTLTQPTASLYQQNFQQGQSNNSLQSQILNSNQSQSKYLPIFDSGPQSRSNSNASLFFAQDPNPNLNLNSNNAPSPNNNSFYSFNVSDFSSQNTFNNNSFSMISPALAASFGSALPMSLIPNFLNISASTPQYPILKDNNHKKSKRFVKSKSKETSNDPLNPKKYRCAHCTWSFTRPSDLRRHLKSHNRPQYHCPFWNAKYATCPHKKHGSFNRLDVLKRHLKLVHYDADIEDAFKAKRKRKNNNSNGNNNNDNEVSDYGAGDNDEQEINDSGYCLSCNKHFDHAKDFITHVPACAENTPMKEWKYKKSGIISHVRKQGDNPNDELEIRLIGYDSDEDAEPPTNHIYSTDTLDSAPDLDSDQRTFTVSVNDVDTKPEIMVEALNRKRGRPKKIVSS